jgi:hypothetical protein
MYYIHRWLTKPVMFGDCSRHNNDATDAMNFNQQQNGTICRQGL